MQAGRGAQEEAARSGAGVGRGTPRPKKRARPIAGPGSTVHGWTECPVDPPGRAVGNQPTHPTGG